MAYPNLIKAVVYMQLDNGWLDRVGAAHAVNTAAGILEQAAMQEAEAWCDAAEQAGVPGCTELEVACTGNDITAEGGLGLVMTDGEQTVIVPDRVSHVLNTLFDAL